MNYNLTIYKSWDLQKPKFPPRSQLYCLEPVGIGTPEVECLTGYIARLAQEHHLITGVLVLSHIAPQIVDGYVFDGKDKDLTACYSSACSRGLNQTGSRAFNLIKALANVTKRDDLRSLTLISFADVLSNIGLLRGTKAWCPLCYYEWEQSGQIVYEPLIWAFDLVTICPRHHLPLLLLCPHCQTKIPFLTWLSRPGYCSKCFKWLGNSHSNQIQKNCHNLSQELEQELWAVKNIGDLLAAEPYLSKPLTKQNIQKSLIACVDNITSRNQTAFAKLIGKAASSVQGWYNGDELLTLKSLLNISFTLKIPLLDFLNATVEKYNFNSLKTQFVFEPEPKRKSLERQTHNKQLIEQALIAAMNEYPPPSLTQLQQRLGLKCRTVFYKYFPELSRNLSAWHIDCRRKIKLDRIQQALLSEIDSNEYPPPTIAEIAKRINVDLRSLYRHFPDLCHILSTRYIRYRHSCALTRAREIRSLIRQAVFKLHEQGINPSPFQLSKILKKPGIMRDPRASEAFEEVLHELGYKTDLD
jgi:AraC-like DNA-binding protein